MRVASALQTAAILFGISPALAQDGTIAEKPAIVREVGVNEAKTSPKAERRKERIAKREQRVNNSKQNYWELMQEVQDLRRRVDDLQTQVDEQSSAPQIDINSIPPRELAKLLDEGQKELVKKVSPSVVYISTLHIEDISPNITTISSGIGSGCIVDEDGYILTNDHVVPPDMVYKNFPFLFSFVPIRVPENPIVQVSLHPSIGSDTPYMGFIEARDPGNDLAMIRIYPPKKLPALPFAKNNPDIGETVFAVGQPDGEEWSFGKSQVGGLYRQRHGLVNLIQIDGHVNPGNSGGPLVNWDGEIVGINTLKGSDGYEGMGYCVSASKAKDFVTKNISRKQFVTAPPKPAYVPPKPQVPLVTDTSEISITAPVRK